VVVIQTRGRRSIAAGGDAAIRGVPLGVIYVTAGTRSFVGGSATVAAGGKSIPSVGGARFSLTGEEEPAGIFAGFIIDTTSQGRQANAKDGGDVIIKLDVVVAWPGLPRRGEGFSDTIITQAPDIVASGSPDWYGGFATIDGPDAALYQAKLHWLTARYWRVSSAAGSTMRLVLPDPRSAPILGRTLFWIELTASSAVGLTIYNAENEELATLDDAGRAVEVVCVANTTRAGGWVIG
jgi:hypothetical protein